jgi:boron transporter
MTTRQFQESSTDSALVSLILALLVVALAQVFNMSSNSSLFHRHARRFLSDYGLPISVIAVSACAYWGRFKVAEPAKLPVGGAFEAAGGREWFVPFWKMGGDPKWIGIAIPFGFVCVLSLSRRGADNDVGSLHFICI